MHPKDIILCLQHRDHNEDSYGQWTIEKGIDNFVKTEFTCGACYHLAYAIHIKTGWLIHSVNDEHYYVVNNKGYAVDIYGIRPTSKAPTKYDKSYSEKAKLIKNSEYEDVSDSEYYHWSLKLIENFSKYFGI